MMTIKTALVAALLMVTPVFAANAPVYTTPDGGGSVTQTICPRPEMPTLDQLLDEAKLKGVPEIASFLSSTGSSIYIWDVYILFGDPTARYMVAEFDANGCYLKSDLLNEVQLKDIMGISVVKQ